MSVEKKAIQVTLLLFDVDGVLTDGRVILNSDGSESKQFHVRDGVAIVWAQRVGLKVGLLSGRISSATTQRAAQLNIPLVVQGAESKLKAYEKILKENHLTDADVAYIGDDLIDLPVLSRAGLSAAPADAVLIVRKSVDWVSTCPAGAGAVRELVELVLSAQGKWDVETLTDIPPKISKNE